MTDAASTIYKASGTHSGITSSHIKLLFSAQVAKEKQICLTPGVTDQVTVRISVFKVSEAAFCIKIQRSIQKSESNLMIISGFH